MTLSAGNTHRRSSCGGEPSRCDRCRRVGICRVPPCIDPRGTWCAARVRSPSRAGQLQKGANFKREALSRWLSTDRNHPTGGGAGVPSPVPEQHDPREGAAAAVDVLLLRPRRWRQRGAHALTAHARTRLHACAGMRVRKHTRVRPRTHAHAPMPGRAGCASAMRRLGRSSLAADLAARGCRVSRTSGTWS